MIKNIVKDIRSRLIRDISSRAMLVKRADMIAILKYIEELEGKNESNRNS